MHEDEQLAHERIRDTFQRFDDTTTQYHDRVRELREDALLVEFERSSDTVTAALACQAGQAEYNGKPSDNIRPTVRVGIANQHVWIAYVVRAPGADHKRNFLDYFTQVILNISE